MAADTTRDGYPKGVRHDVMLVVSGHISKLFENMPIVAVLIRLSEKQFLKHARLHVHAIGESPYNSPIYSSGWRRYRRRIDLPTQYFRFSLFALVFSSVVVAALIWCCCAFDIRANIRWFLLGGTGTPAVTKYAQLERRSWEWPESQKMLQIHRSLEAKAWWYHQS